MDEVKQTTTTEEEPMFGSNETKKWVKANKAHRIAEFNGVHLFPDRLVRVATQEVVPLAGVSAEVETAGGVASRGTLTRSAAVGGWQKKIDTREAMLIIDGPDFQWVLPFPAQVTTFIRIARQFASKVNNTSRQLSAGSRNGL